MANDVKRPEKTSLLEFYENSFPDVLVAEVDGYMLFKEDWKKKGFLYSVYDPDYTFVTSWRAFNDIEKAPDIKKSVIYKRFLLEVEQDKTGDYTYDDYDYDPYNDTVSPLQARQYRLSSQPHSNVLRGGTSYWAPVKEKGVAEKLCNSNTLVFHRDDPSTIMLRQIYEGKGWDVLTKSCNAIDDQEVKELFEKHERLVFLGHGTPYGLIGMFGPEVAPYMKDKKIFAIWCNADGYFIKHGIGQGQFVTGNMPSEVWECRAAGCGNISSQLMLDNITYWSKLCADKVEDCLEGNVKESVDYIRKNYLEQYGNHPVTIYNCNRTQCLGEPQPLPKYEFKGKPLGPSDLPYPGFDEKKFLENPTEHAVHDIDIPPLSKPFEIRGSASINKPTSHEEGDSLLNKNTTPDDSGK